MKLTHIKKPVLAYRTADQLTLIFGVPLTHPSATEDTIPTRKMIITNTTGASTGLYQPGDTITVPANLLIQT